MKGDHPRTIPTKFALIWFNGFRGEDLNVILYQNMSNLYNQYKSVEGKNSRKKPEYMLIYSLSCIFASQGLRFGSPFSPPLADLEYILRIHALIFDWIRVLVAVTNEILKRESSKCILDLPRVERRGTRIVTLG